MLILLDYASQNTNIINLLKRLINIKTYNNSKFVIETKLLVFISKMKYSQKYEQKVEKASKVLLVCIYDTIVIDISNQMIRAKFEPFGTINKMLIFQKGEVTKLFIQFSQIYQATQAKQKLDGTKLYGSICKMSIFFSNFSNVQVAAQPQQNKYYNEQEYYQMGYQQQMSLHRQPQRFPTFQIKDNRTFLNYSIDDDDIMNSFSTFADLRKSKTQNPAFLKQQIQKMNHDRQISYQYQNNYRVAQNPMSQMNTSTSINYKLKKQEQNIKLKQQSEVRSSVLFFPNKKELKPKWIYNLFSNFGNLSSVTIKKQYVYIKFRTKQFAAMASTYINGSLLMGNLLQLRECPEQSTCWKLNQGQYSQAVYYDNTSDRFTAQRSITINPPAHTIHVSSIKKEICKQRCLRDIFEEYGEIQRIQILKNSGDKNMALIKFVTIQDSFNAIANLHNESFQGRRLQISFTKSKV